MHSVASRRTANKHHNSRPPLVPSTATQSAIVFSWNDFLCPIEIFHAAHAMPSQAQLAQLDQSIVQLLLHAQTIAPVFVLCESGAAFMETLCMSLFPRCAQLFASPEMQRRIQLVCAATSLTPQWHGQMLHMITTLRLPMTMRPGMSCALVVFGKETMRAGCLALAKFAPTCIQPKVLTNAVTSVDVVATMQRLAAVGQSLHTIVSHAGAIDIVV
ncbi:Aste57867_17674 [Aphanomyces stellatus]|uniref:Aste57867_17674 protein n=1 Tax=Aphanomyces stellatus TaxID=120398 RepID=A0A485L953_9STRA|nr:hypothetical protein As57867_017613 [Aphanomyces stellatus]VFT94425.1 Aste57867_17674 [Aphanomyces stellatus]